MEMNKFKRSDDYIIEAFVKLLSIKDYEKISITDITNKAGIARVTFYRHFSGIDDIFDNIIYRVSDALTKSLLPVLKKNNFDDWYAFIKSFLQNLYNNKGDIMKITDHNKDIIFKKLDDKYRKIQDQKLEHITDFRQRYDFELKIGVIIYISRERARSNFKESVEDVTNYVTTKVMKI